MGIRRIRWEFYGNESYGNPMGIRRIRWESHGNLMNPLGFLWESYESYGIPMGILRVLWDSNGNPTGSL
eukprot:796405-Pyramimonas_sp.AAC.1